MGWKLIQTGFVFVVVSMFFLWGAVENVLSEPLLLFWFFSLVGGLILIVSGIIVSIWV